MRVVHAGIAQQRGHHIVLAQQAVAHEVLRHTARHRRQRGDFHRRVVHIRRVCAVALAPNAVMPHAHAVVRHEHNQRAFAQSVRLQPVEYAPDVAIHLGYGGEVAAQRDPAVLRRVADCRSRWLFGELIRVHRLVRHGVEGAVVVEIVEHGVGVFVASPRRVRRGVMHIQRERRVRTELPVQEIERVVGDDVGNILVGLRALAVENHRRGVVVSAAGGMHIPERKARAPQRRMPDVPLAAKSALVAVLREQLDVCRLSRDVVDFQAVVGQEGGIARAQEVLHAVLRRDAPGEYRRARRRANGRRAEEIIEANTRRRQPIEIGRNHLVIPGAAHSPSPLVIAQDKQNVRTVGVGAWHGGAPCRLVFFECECIILDWNNRIKSAYLILDYQGNYRYYLAKCDWHLFGAVMLRLHTRMNGNATRKYCHQELQMLSRCQD